MKLSYDELVKLEVFRKALLEQNYNVYAQFTIAEEYKYMTALAFESLILNRSLYDNNNFSKSSFDYGKYRAIYTLLNFEHKN